MNNELKCPVCGHDIAWHGGTGCSFRIDIDSWCRCKMSACAVNLDWLKREHQGLKANYDDQESTIKILRKSNDLIHDKLKIAKEGLNKIIMGKPGGEINGFVLRKYDEEVAEEYLQKLME